MSTEETILRTEGLPLTTRTATHQIQRLGVRPGSLLLVHSSLSRLGWVCGGPIAVIDALTQALGPGGTLVMPAHSGDLTDPAQWVNPPVPESWWKVIREEMPAFRADATPTRGMGRIAETFRSMPGVLRSPHPHVSFTARGPRASEITASHSLDYGLGDDSPLGRLYELEADVLLLGVGHDSDTSLHLAEYRAEWPSKKPIIQGAPILVEGERQWIEIQDVSWDDSDFQTIGKAFEESGPKTLRLGRIGQAEARLFAQKDLVDFAVTWMETHRG